MSPHVTRSLAGLVFSFASSSATPHLLAAQAAPPRPATPARSVPSAAQRARTLSQSGKFQAAVSTLQDALKTAPPATQAALKAQLADTHAAWAEALASRANYGAAQTHRKAALELDRTPRPHQAVLHLLEMGRYALNLEQPTAATSFYTQAVNLAQTARDAHGQALALLEQGKMYRLGGQVGYALTAFTTALTLARQQKDDALLIRALSSNALLQSDLDQFTPALDKLSEALRRARARKNKAEQADALSDLGAVYGDKEELVNSLRYYRAALDLYRALNDVPSQLRIINNLGIVYGILHRTNEAEALYKTGIALARKNGDRYTEAYLQEGIANIALDRDQPKVAAPLYQLALRVKRSIGDKAGLVSTLGNLMECQRQLGNEALAIFYGKSAIEITEGQRASLAGMPEEVRRAYLNSITGFYRVLAELLIKQDRLLEAENVLRLLKQQEYREFTREAKPTEGENALARNSREQQVQGQETALADQVLALARERATLEVSGANPTRLAAVTTLLDTANQRYATFLKQLPTMFATPEASDNSEVVLSQLKQFQKQRAVLKKFPQTVALYTVITPQRYSVILFSANAATSYSYDISAQALKDKIVRLRVALQDETVDPRPLARELYKILFCEGKVEQELQQYGAQTLLWSLDGALRLLPPGVLYDGKDYLVRRYNSATVTREGLVAAPNDTNTKHSWQVLGFGATGEATVKAAQLQRGERDYYFQPLPGVKTELETLIREPGEQTGLLQGQREMDAQFNRAHMLQLLRTGDKVAGNDTPEKFPVVHIASHFHCGATPEESFLLLGDRKVITLADLSTEGVTSQLFEDVDLLTFSACSTGVAAAEPGAVGREVDTLGSIAQEQGARSVMVSLWPISDAGTPELMKQFYSLHAAHPDWSKAKLLQAAQLALLDGQVSAAPTKDERGASIATAPPGGANELPAFTPDPNAPLSHPRYWATFILLGSWQ